ncbi:hypothetical protein Ancab_021952 [Ancistrocladus abbreviatus]
MMGPRVSEISRRQPPRRPHDQRTTSSDSDPLPRRNITNKSVRVGDHRSPRGSQSDPPNHKKLGTRISDLENQLGQAQQELKSLKQQLASAEAAKQEAQEKLHKGNKKQPAKPEAQTQASNIHDKCPSRGDEVTEDPHRETDVFEVPVEKTSIELDHPSADNEKDTKLTEPEKPSIEEVARKNEEISQLKVMVEEKEKEMKLMSHENECLKKQVEDAATKMASNEEEMLSKLHKLEEELMVSKANVLELNVKLEATEEAKETLEAEMKKLRVQTEQWRKAADAAAAVLSGGVDMDNGRNISDRCGSMDKHFNGIFDLGSPGASDELIDDGLGGGGGGKRKVSGIKMFGDLWKKKGQR